MNARVDYCIKNGEDLYYSICKFQHRGRKIADTMPNNWLWADLDEVHPSVATKKLEFMPTVAIESSPGRYQALWKLNKKVSPKTLERLNRALTYALDADKGGWDLTQVLRVPGTHNFKYRDTPWVKMIWLEEDLVYSHRDIWNRVRGLVPAAELISGTQLHLPRKALTRRAKQLLQTRDVVTGERSERLWELNCLLAEAGRTPDEIFELVSETPWNKWPEHPGRLRDDIQKALNYIGRKLAQTTEVKPTPPEPVQIEAGGLPFVEYGSFMSMTMESPRWLIEDIWVANSYGLIAGEPKTNKTTLALALSVAVASGNPFLGVHPVSEPGAVLFIQEENAPWMLQDRLRKLAHYHGMLNSGVRQIRSEGAGSLGRNAMVIEFPRDYPMKFLNNWGFNLSLSEHQDMLEAEIAEYKPALLVLDPMYLIFGGIEENSSSALFQPLSWLKNLRYTYGCAIMLVHHFKKQNTQKGAPQVREGQRMLGSTTLHGWVDSALYLELMKPPRVGWVKTRIQPEFRAMAPRGPMELAFSLGSPGELDMSVEFDTKTIDEEILDIVLEHPGVSANVIASRVNLHRRTVVERCKRNKQIEVKIGGGAGNATKLYPVSMNGT